MQHLTSLGHRSVTRGLREPAPNANVSTPAPHGTTVDERRPTVAPILAAANTRRVFGVIGGSLNGFMEALRANGAIRLAGVRQEETNAFAEAAVTGQLAVCAGSCGLVNIHLVNSLVERAAASPSGDRGADPRNEIGRGCLQKTHAERLFQERSHFYEIVTEVLDLPGPTWSAGLTNTQTTFHPTARRQRCRPSPSA